MGDRSTSYLLPNLLPTGSAGCGGDSLAAGHSAYRAWNSPHWVEHSKPPVWNSAGRAEGWEVRAIFSTFAAWRSAARVQDWESGADGSTCRAGNSMLRARSLGSAVLRGEAREGVATPSLGPADPASLRRFSLQLTAMGSPTPAPTAVDSESEILGGGRGGLLRAV